MTGAHSTRRADEARELLWAYCIAHADDPLPEGHAGVAGGACVSVRRRGLALLASPVPRSEFRRNELYRNLNDIGWLEQVARAHEAVLDQAIARATVLPLRLCTIFESERSIRRVLAQRQEALSSALESLAGRSEWAVKVVADPASIARATYGEVHDDTGGSGPGRSYLERRRRERTARELGDDLAAFVSGQVDLRLRAEAVASVVRPAQDRELSGHRGEMLLNAAYLVDPERVGRLRELVDQLNAAHAPLGIGVELSGPWPPYNFVPETLARPT